MRVQSGPDDVRKSLLQKDLRIKDLEAEVERLKHSLRQAERTEEKAVNWAGQVAGQARGEKARYKEVKSANEELERQVQKFKAGSEELKKDVSSFCIQDEYTLLH